MGAIEAIQKLFCATLNAQSWTTPQKKSFWYQHFKIHGLPKELKINSLRYPEANSRGHPKSNIKANTLVVVVIMLGKHVNSSVLNTTAVERFAILPESVVPRQ